MTKTRRAFSDEFKQQLLSQVEELGNAATVAREHQIDARLLSRWKKKFKKQETISQKGPSSVTLFTLVNKDKQLQEQSELIRQCEEITRLILDYVSTQNRKTINAALEKLQTIEFTKRSELRMLQVDASLRQRASYIPGKGI